MPKALTASRLVDRATKWCSTASSPSASTSQDRAERALVMVSRVVKVLEATTTRVRAGSRPRNFEVEVGPVDVGHEAEVEVPVDEGVECDGGHGRAEVGAADADVDDVGQPLPRDASAFPGTHGGGEASHLVEDLVHIGNDVVARVFDDRARRRSKGDVEDGPVLGEVDVLAGEHGVPKAFDLGRSGQVGEQSDRLPGDPVLRVVEVEVPDLDDEVGAPGRGRRRRGPGGGRRPGPERWSTRAAHSGDWSTGVAMRRGYDSG